MADNNFFTNYAKNQYSQFGDYKKAADAAAAPFFGPSKAYGYVDDYLNQMKGYQDQLAKGGYDQGEANRYYSEQEQPINQGFGAASEASAASLARRGLGNSGLNAGSQMDVAGRAAALKRMARMLSIDQATAHHRQQILDQMSAAQNSFNAANMRHMQQVNEDDKQLAMALGIVGTGVGAISGAPPMQQQNPGMSRDQAIQYMINAPQRRQEEDPLAPYYDSGY